MTKAPPSARPVSDGRPGCPSVISGFPSRVNFRAVWSPLSTVHTESSGPTVSPCGLVKPSPPHAVTNVPSASYTSTFESNRVLAAVEERVRHARQARPAGRVDVDDIGPLVGEQHGGQRPG